MKQTLYLSNWASACPEGHHGPGRKLRIMARPGRWECGEGYEGLLTPTVEALQVLERRRWVRGRAGRWPRVEIRVE